MSKYIVDYSSTSGYGWTKEYDRVESVDGIVNEHRHNKYTGLTVYDCEHGDFIFWKDIFSGPSIDLLGDHNARDLRTVTRMRKGAK